MTSRRARTDPGVGTSSVDLYWMPLGAGKGGGCVRTSGRLYERLAAARAHRTSQRLYHSALIVRWDETPFTIEMTPVWAAGLPDRGVVGEGAVGLPALRRSRLFRYEVRCWREGTIPDLGAAVDSPRRVSEDPLRARRVLDLVARFPLATWGLDEQHAGEMWNSNSLTSWLLAGSGHDTEDPATQPPARGRAPGWSAGLVVAHRDHAIRGTYGPVPTAAVREECPSGRPPRRGLIYPHLTTEGNPDHASADHRPRHQALRQGRGR